MAGGQRKGMSNSQVKARRARIAKAVRAGSTALEVAERFGVSVNTVYRACRGGGVALGPGGEAGNKARRARRAIAQAVKRGAGMDEAMERFGASADRVRRACGEHGVEPPPSVDRKRLPSLLARALAGAAMNHRGADTARRRAGKNLPAYARPISPRDRAVWDLLTTTDLTLEEIGGRFGVSRQRVEQIGRAVRERLPLPIERGGGAPAAGRPSPRAARASRRRTTSPGTSPRRTRTGRTPRQPR
jgi:transposase